MSLPNWYTSQITGGTSIELLERMHALALELAGSAYDNLVASPSFAEHFQTAQNGEIAHFQGVDDTNWREVSEILTNAIQQAAEDEPKSSHSNLHRLSRLGFSAPLLLACMVCVEKDRMQQMRSGISETIKFNNWFTALTKLEPNAPPY